MGSVGLQKEGLQEGLLTEKMPLDPWSGEPVFLFSFLCSSLYVFLTSYLL